MREVEIVDPDRVRFVLKEPWPDFMTFYGTPATGAGWIVPKKYVEKVGDDGFKKAPVGAGPYKFVSFKPGVELVLEAFDGLLAQGARGEAPGLAQHPRRDHARGRAEARRGGHRLPLRPARWPRSSSARPGSSSARRCSHGHLLARLPRPVGSEVAVARPARAPGRQPRHRPEAINQAETLGLRQGHRRLRPAAMFEFALPIEPPALRSRARQAAPRRGRATRTASTPATSRRCPPYSSLGEAVVGYLQARRHPQRACARWSAPPS